MRVLVGGVTARSALLRVEGAEADEVAVTLDPQPAALAIAERPAPLLGGERTRKAFALTGLDPGTAYRAWATRTKLGEPARFETCPDAVDIGQPLTIGLASCVFPSHAFGGRPDVARRCWQPDGYPQVVLHCGDQIYADVPGMTGEIQTHFRSRYAAAWRADRLGALLGLGGHLFTPDDHEYWNDYPRRSFYLPQSGDGTWAGSARVAADAYWANQGFWNFAPGLAGGVVEQRGWAHGDVGGIPLFVADTRTDRSLPDGSRSTSPHLAGGVPSPGRAHFTAARQFNALLSWLDTIPTLGMLALGQPLATTTSSLLGLYTTDYALCAYTDQFARLMDRIRITIGRGVTLLLLSGDIHWGRLVEWAAPGAARGRLIEFVASPIGRVGEASILSSKRDGGSHRSINAKDWKALDVVSRFLPGCAPGIKFATGDNNVGSLRFERWASGERFVRLRSYSLESVGIAPNEAGTGSGTCDCTFPY